VSAGQFLAEASAQVAGLFQPSDDVLVEVRVAYLLEDTVTATRAALQDRAQTFSLHRRYLFHVLLLEDRDPPETARWHGQPSGSPLSFRSKADARGSRGWKVNHSGEGPYARSGRSAPE
jgi:hypothetical protein